MRHHHNSKKSYNKNNLNLRDKNRFQSKNHADLKNFKKPVDNKNKLKQDDTYKSFLKYCDFKKRIEKNIKKYIPNILAMLSTIVAVCIFIFLEFEINYFVIILLFFCTSISMFLCLAISKYDSSVIFKVLSMFLSNRAFKKNADLNKLLLISQKIKTEEQIKNLGDIIKGKSKKGYKKYLLKSKKEQAEELRIKEQKENLSAAALLKKQRETKKQRNKNAKEERLKEIETILDGDEFQLIND